MKRAFPPCPVWGGVPRGYGRLQRQAAFGRFPAGEPEARNGFVRGVIAAGLVAATATQRPARKEALRLALQGGAAMAAGIAGANALDRRDYGAAVLAVAVGAVGLSAINQLLSDSSSSNNEATDE